MSASPLAKRPRKHDLSRDEWTKIGATLKQADHLLWQVVKKVQASVSTVMQDKIIKVTHRIGVLKNDLENEAARQHPEWGPPNRVFFGPPSDSNDAAEKGTDP